MKCPNCNSIIEDNSLFCSTCGIKITTDEPTKKVSLKCESCNGVMTVDSDKSILSCPYCGAKELIIENDSVK